MPPTPPRDNPIIHPQRVKLRQRLRGELRPQCEQWLGSEGSEALFQPALKELVRLVSALRFIPTSERPIEAQHAKTHKRGLGHHHHSEAYMSQYLRKAEVVDMLEKRPESLKNLAFFCTVGRNATRSRAALGLSHHQSILAATSEKRMDRGPSYSKVS